MKKNQLFTLVASFFAIGAMAQIPTSYDVENTAAGNPDPVFPSIENLPYIEPLTDPFEFSDGSGRALDFSQWSTRRGEIAREIMHYEIGDKPAVSMDDIEASMNGNTLTVKVTVNGQTLTLTSSITYPSTGTAPYPIMIGADNNSLSSSMFSSRGIAQMTFTASQVNGYSQFGGSGSRGSYPIDKLYPELVNNGAYSHWAWGFSRLIDGLQKLGPEVTKIDTKHIGVTGCSYAGKMALYCGAFDERVCLTIPQESGGGGCAAWRVTRVHNRDYTKEDSWEGLDNTDYSWFMQSLKSTFGQDNTFYLPYDHHELVALCCPRGLLMLGNPDYRWLADGSGYISMIAARKVWEQYGIGDRCGYSIVAGHSHCQLPSSQNAIVEAYLDKFLLDKDVDLTKVSQYNVAPLYEPGGDRCTLLEEPGQWMNWWGTGEAPLLPNGKVAPKMVWCNPTANPISEGNNEWVIEDDETSPTGKKARPLAKNSDCPEDANLALKIVFTIDSAANYYPYAYVNCDKTSNDGFFMVIDDSKPVTVNGARTRGEWDWKNLYNLITDDKSAYTRYLTVGEHTLYLYSKEVDAMVAIICMSTDDLLNDFNNDIKKVDLTKVFDTSGIGTVYVAKPQNGVIYNLSGQKVNAEYKGIVIQNGKKILRK